MPDLLPLALATLVSFVAGLVDAMAGGGGILTMPTSAGFGLPVAFIGGTNKVVGTSGSSMATLRFLLHGKLHRPTVLIAAPLSAIGAGAGALALIHLGRFDERLGRGLIAGLLLVMAVYLFLKPQLAEGTGYPGASPRTVALTAATGLTLGFYDGFFGPGTGSFLGFAMVRLLGFDFIVGTGNAKALNFASNLASVVTFIVQGKVVWLIALPMGAANAAGAYLGASLAIRRGARFVRWVFLAMAVAIAARLIVAAATGR